MTLHSPIVLSIMVSLVGCTPSAPGPEAVVEHGGLEAERSALDFDQLPAAPLSDAEVFARAGWGDGEGEVDRELAAAHTGPMAIAAGAGGALALLDTVGGRIHRYDGQGGLEATVAIGVETGDDLVALPDGALAVLVYQRRPEPHHELRVFDRDGGRRAALAAPRAATMPTALLSDGDQLLVEQRHGWALAADGSARRWGRPVGDLLLRAEVDGRALTLTARSRSGQAAWVRRLEAPWSITEVLTLDGCDRFVVVAFRRVDEAEASQESWAVLFTLDGAPLGRHPLRDELVTDAGRTLTVSPGGDLFELTTDEAGAAVLRSRWQGGER